MKQLLRVLLVEKIWSIYNQLNFSLILQQSVFARLYIFFYFVKMSLTKDTLNLSFFSFLSIIFAK